jgi:eukaryotic-like serine/threonine-protein kinase
VDSRADIWAFGVVLHEMLTGRRLFHGESTPEVLASVIKEEPDWNRVPAQARLLLRRCLEKDPKRRLRDIGDAMPLLEIVPAPAPKTRSRTAWIAWSAAAVVLLAAGVAGFLYVRERQSAPAAEVSRFQIPFPERVVVGAFNISPDGRRLVFYGRLAEEPSGRLYLRDLDSLETRPLPGTEGTTSYPFWSPDSRFVAFDNGGKLRKIDVSGGPPEIICEFPVDGLYGGSWNRDDVIIFGARQGVMKVSASGGTPSAVTRPEDDRFPWFLPDGRHFVYIPFAPPAGRAAYLGSLDTKPEEQSRKPLLATPTTVAYVPSGGDDGKLLFLRNGALLAQTFDMRRAELTGEAVTVAERVGTNGSLYGYFSASANGVLVYRMAPNQDSQLMWYDREGKVLGTPGEPGAYNFMTLSPDAKRAAVLESGDVWVVDLTRGTKTRLTSDHAATFPPVWSPDGSRIAYSASRGGAYGIYAKASSGAGADELLLKTEGLVAPNHWSPDGRFLLFGPSAQKTGYDLWILPLEGDRQPFPFLATEFTETGGRFSPNGHWIAYRSDESGRNEIYVQPFNLDASGRPSFSGAKWAVSKGGSLGMPRWRSDGKELYYLSLDGKIKAVDVATNPTFHAGEPKPLFPVRSDFLGPATLPGSRVDATADGKRFLFLIPVPTSTRDEFNVVLNWPAGLAK